MVMKINLSDRHTPLGRGKHKPLPKYHELYYALWEDRSWINRRIDEVKIISANSTNTRSTFDLNIKRLNEIARKNDFPNNEIIPVPLLIQPRRQLLDADIDLNGKPQSLAGTLPSARVATCIYLHDYFSSSKELFDQNFPIAYRPIYKMMIHGANIPDEDTEQIQKSITTAEGVLNSELNEKNVVNLKDLVNNYILVVYLDRLEDFENAKLTCSFSTMSESEPSSSTKESAWKKAIELLKPRQSDFDFLITGTQLGTAFEERYHLKFKIPNGQHISSLSFEDDDKTKKKEDKEKARNTGSDRTLNDSNKGRQGSDQLLSRKAKQPVTPKKECPCTVCEQVFMTNCRIAYSADSLNIHDLAEKPSPQSGVKLSVRIGMEPNFRNFKYPSLLCLLVLMIYLGVIYFYPGGSNTPLDIPTFSLTTAAFFLATPFLFRKGSEHDFTNMTLRSGRFAVGAVATACIGMGIFSIPMGKWICDILGFDLVRWVFFFVSAILVIICVSYTFISITKVRKRKLLFKTQISLINANAKFSD